MTQDRVTRSAVRRAPKPGEASPQDELLEAAEAALAWMRDCSPMGDEERLDREADLRVRLRRAIRGVKR